MFNERRDNVFLVAVVTTSVGVDKMPLRQRKLTTFSHRKLTQLYRNKFTFQIRCANVFSYVVPQRCGDVRLSQQNAVERT